MYSSSELKVLDEHHYQLNFESIDQIKQVVTQIKAEIDLNEERKKFFLGEEEKKEEEWF